MESYLLLEPTTAGAASTGISNPAETTAAAVNTRNEPMTDLMKQLLERTDRMKSSFDDLSKLMKLRSRQKGANLIQEGHQSFAGTATDQDT